MHRTANVSVQKPENILKRVNELIKSGNNSDKVKTLALEQLHNMFTQKKRTFQKIFETIMKRHLELCVDLKDYRTAKDGLHQYRTMTQLVDPQSLEAVAMHLIELAEVRAADARTKADKVALAAAAKISDLDQEETPESIMLSSMTYEGARDRTNREVVVPWLKFLWETYRTVLELLYKNTRLERMYHRTCEKAFKFCLDYQRTNEFKRLCEMLRAHLGNLQRATQQSLRANKPAWEWTAEGVELHLQTRFSQLEVATSLELWNEGFRTVEDIYDIMQINKKTPKSRLMVAYYEKLTRIFLVSENYLFHAYAWHRYYCLCIESKKDLRPEERALQASCVLLSALCIPNFREADGAAAVLDEDEAVSERNAHMALLLDFQANPTRQALLGEMVSKGVLQEVPPELSALYHCLEAGFRPLNLMKDIVPLLAFIKNDPNLSIYSLPLQRVALLRSVMQLSRVFSTLRMSYLKDLVKDLDLSYCDVEKLLIDGAASKQLHLRIDHCNACIRFGTAVAVNTAIETQAVQLGSQLNRVADTIASAKSHDEVVASRRAYLEQVSSTLDDLYAQQVERRAFIERRKEELEKFQFQKQQHEQRLKETEEARRREEESQRLKKEEEARKIAKEKKARDQMDVAKTKKALEAHGKIVDESVLNELDETSRRALLKEAQSDAQRAKEDESRRLLDQQKRLDYVTRALRLEAAEAIAAKYKEDVEADRKEFEVRLAQSHEEQKKAHALALEEKGRLAKVQPLRGAFEGGIVALQKAAYDARMTVEREKALAEYRQRKVARARQLLEEEIERREYEAEEVRLQHQREEERQRRAAEGEDKRLAKLAAEEEKRARDADLERKRLEQIAMVAQRKKEEEEARSRPAGDEPSWSRRGAPAREPSGREPPSRESADWQRPRGDAPRGQTAAAAGDASWRGGSESRLAEGGAWTRPQSSKDDAPPQEAQKPLTGLDRLAALKAGGGSGRKDDARPSARSGWGGGSTSRDRPATESQRGENSRWK